MSWATATCKCEKCGSIFHPRKECYNSREAADWEEWAADHITVCGECKEKAVQAKRAEQADEAKKTSEAAGYPELVGSEKQIAWAMRSRQEKAAELDAIRARVNRIVAKYPERKERGDEMLAAIERIMAHDKAAWWIYMRFDTPDMMVNGTIKAMRKEKK